jgi:hypothetical protein
MNKIGSQKTVSTTKGWMDYANTTLILTTDSIKKAKVSMNRPYSKRKNQSRNPNLPIVVKAHKKNYINKYVSLSAQT